MFGEGREGPIYRKEERLLNAVARQVLSQKAERDTVGRTSER